MGALVRTIILFLMLAPGAWAQDKITVRVDQAISRNNARVGIGSPVTLQFPKDPSAHAGIFLGQMVRVDQKIDQMILLDLDRKRVFFVDRSRVDLNARSLERVLRPYPQVDGTCTGYALHHLMAELAVLGQRGNATLKAAFSSEQNRTQFLVRAINDYYLATQHRYSIIGILKGYGKEFGLECEYKKFSHAEQALRHIAEKNSQGIPVLMAFNIGSQMVNSDFTLQDLSAGRSLLDSRLWIPRKVGERAGGGHSVLAVATFEAQGKPRILMLDSDWAQARVWDAAFYLSERTKMDEVELYSCE